MMGQTRWKLVLCTAAATISAHETNSSLSTMSQAFNGPPSSFAKPLALTCSCVLNAAFKWLSAEERHNDDACRGVSWINPALQVLTIAGPTRNENVEDSSMTSLMPLHPLSAMCLPVRGINFTLNNVEPRNLGTCKWLLISNDSNDSKGKGNQCFCAVLSASDTGWIALVGTMLKRLDDAKQEGDGQMVRVVVACQAQEAVEICSIENPNCSSSDSIL